MTGRPPDVGSLIHTPEANKTANNHDLIDGSDFVGFPELLYTNESTGRVCLRDPVVNNQQPDVCSIAAKRAIQAHDRPSREEQRAVILCVISGDANSGDKVMAWAQKTGPLYSWTMLIKQSSPNHSLFPAPMLEFLVMRDNQHC
ncbi:hypothetical protein N7465_004115 [Penicillium sp. CMV-2018d]|nr:hypothetical protein N7465_004115 [Penicillium sp. CMV-2018d]